jgi:heme/copper-type cytochrome/quinol oxidase subunit 2
MSYDTTTVTTASAGVILFSLIAGLIGFIFALVLYWRIFSKAGYSGARSLLMLIPVVNLIIIIMFAFAEWPVQRELKQLRQAAGGGLPPQYPPQAPQYQQPGQYAQP